MPKNKTYIIGNWKLHGDALLMSSMLEALQALPRVDTVEAVLCPPVTLLHLAKGKTVLGAQDCSAQAQGAHTGEISAAMLREAGCDYVIVGHSERRSQHGETDGLVCQKAKRAMENGLTPIICIGESLAERESGRAEAVVGGQLAASLPGVEGEFLLAYEPVWAIGSGKTPTVQDISHMHAYIKALASQRTGLAQARISVLYGGSVKAANAKEILNADGVDGVLVGGASLKAEEFCGIIKGVLSD